MDNEILVGDIEDAMWRGHMETGNSVLARVGAAVLTGGAERDRFLGATLEAIDNMKGRVLALKGVTK